MIGRILDHYKIESKLGEGGMGAVYLAQDTRLKRPVAIKVLHAESVADPERKRRFVQEAQAASRDKAAFTIIEATGNLWMSELPGR